MTFQMTTSKERTLKEEQTTTVRVGYAVLVSEERGKCQREKVKRVYSNKLRNSTINKRNIKNGFQLK